MDWLIVFSVLMAALAMFKGSVKRVVATKMQKVGNFMVWQRWGDVVPEDSTNPSVSDPAWFKNDLNVQAKIGSTQRMTQTTNEAAGTVTYLTSQSRNQRSASVSTAKDQQYLLANQSISDIPVNIDTR